ncbi:MAG: hypothetical protein J1F64_09285, partial [Oscillospiraceae bacterium]|nr:hypothetical protein [Oscillospiraceae bacterium]
NAIKKIPTSTVITSLIFDIAVPPMNSDLSSKDIVSKNIGYVNHKTTNICSNSTYFFKSLFSIRRSPDFSAENLREHFVYFKNFVLCLREKTPKSR